MLAFGTLFSCQGAQSSAPISRRQTDRRSGIATPIQMANSVAARVRRSPDRWAGRAFPSRIPIVTIPGA